MYKWSDLKTFIEGLNEEQLNQPILCWGESIGGKVFDVYVLKEDHINPSGDGCEPVSVYADDEDLDLSTEPIVAAAGTPIISVDYLDY